MKHLLFLLSFFFFVVPAWSQIAGSEVEKKMPQASQLNAQLVAQPTNENLWLDYFNTTKNSQSRKKGRELPDSAKTTLAKIAQQCATYIPNSYASNYIFYEQLGKTQEGLNYLDKAFQLQPNASLYDDKLAQAVIKKNKEGIEEYSTKLEKAKVFNAAIMQYNKNVLQSVAQNGVLITYGFEDTYPIILLQQKNALRKDVKVICMEWLVNEEYFAQVKSQLNLSINSFSSEKRFLVELHKVSNQKIFIALTLPPHLISAYKENLYATGLTMQLSIKPIDNLALLRKNWDKFELSEIKKEEKINSNYLIPLVLLEKSKQDADSSKFLDLLKSVIGSQKLAITTDSLLH